MNPEANAESLVLRRENWFSFTCASRRLSGFIGTRQAFTSTFRWLRAEKTFNETFNDFFNNRVVNGYAEG